MQVLSFQAACSSEHTSITIGDVVVHDTPIQISTECTWILPDFPRSSCLNVFGRVTLILVGLEFIVIDVPCSLFHYQSTFVYRWCIAVRVHHLSRSSMLVGKICRANSTHEVQ